MIKFELFYDASDIWINPAKVSYVLDGTSAVKHAGGDYHGAVTLIKLGDPDPIYVRGDYNAAAARLDGDLG